MGRLFLHCLCLVSLLSRNLANSTITDDEEPRRTFPIRRAIDGTRGRKYYVPEEDNPYDTYGSSGGRYDPYKEKTDLSDIRNNVPGEPGVDYPSYTRLPQTEFVCEGDFKGYYADEGAGCQVFHVCNGNFLVSSFLCPIGSTFSQKLLTCDWWNKVDCSSTRKYHVIEGESKVSEVDDDDEILRKAFETESVQSAANKIPVETVSQQPKQRHQDRRQQRVFNYASSVTERINDLPTGQESYSDYSDYPSRLSSRYKSTSRKPTRHRYHEEDYYSQNVEVETQQRDNDSPSIRVHTTGEDRKNDHQGSFRNEFQPSYTPTVPTSTTTTKKYYSPTIPTTYKPPITRNPSGRYDLEFESSDHLYTARGRSEEKVKAATPPSFVRTNDVKFANVSLLSMVNSALDVTAKIDQMEESESSQSKIHLPHEEAQRNVTKVDVSNETIASLNHKEKVIKEDLNRLTEKITETLSILTIDNENRDPAVFSYNHDEETITGEKNSGDISEPLVGVNSTSSSLSSGSRKDKKPAKYLRPPKRNENQLRLMVLNETLTGGNEKIPDHKILTWEKNSTEKMETVQAPASGTTTQASSDQRDTQDSRIIRIFANNTAVNSSKESTTIPQIFFEKVKSIDLSPKAIVPRVNLAERRMSPERNDETSEIAKLINETSSNSTKFPKFVPTSTTIRSDVVTEEDKISKSEKSIDVTPEDVTSKESNVTIQLTPTETTSMIPPDEEDVLKQTTQRKEILSNESNIGDTIMLGSSPFQVTLTINKSEEIDPNGDVIRKLIAQQEIGDSISAADYKSFEIVRSEEPQAYRQNTENNNFNYDESFQNEQRTNDQDQTIEENLQNFQANKLQSMNYLRNIVTLVNGPNLPRPFALEHPINVNIKTPSDLSDQLISTSLPSFSQTQTNVIVPETTRAPIRQTQSTVSSTKEPDSEKSLETLESSSSGLPREIKINRAILEQSSQAFAEEERKTNNQKLILELPEPRRIVDFQTGLPLGASEEPNTRIHEEHNNEDLKKTTEETENLHAKTVVQTEFIPSLGFSLNTDEEREEYMEAVVKGLLHDVTAIETTTSNETSTSVES